MASNVDIKLMAGLDIDSSIPQIKDDIAQIQKKLEAAGIKINLVAEIDEQLKDSLKKLSNNKDVATSGKQLGENLAASLINGYNIKSKDAQRQIKNLTRSIFQMSFDEIKSGKDNPEFLNTFNQLGNVVKNNANIIKERMGIYDAFYKYFQGLSNIKIPKIVQNDKDWNDLRKVYAGKFVTDPKKKGIPLDSIYQEMAPKFPDLFSGTPDQTKQFEEIVKAVKLYQHDINGLKPVNLKKAVGWEDNMWSDLLSDIGIMREQIKAQMPQIEEEVKASAQNIKKSLMDIDVSFDSAGVEQLTEKVKGYFTSLDGISDENVKLQFFKNGNEDITSFNATIDKGRGIIEKYNFALNSMGQYVYSGGSIIDTTGKDFAALTTKASEYQQKLELLKTTYKDFLFGDSANNPFKQLVDSIDFTNITDRGSLDEMVAKLKQATEQAKTFNAEITKKWSSNAAEKLEQYIKELPSDLDYLEAKFKGANFKMPENIVQSFANMRKEIKEINNTQDPQQKIEAYNRLTAELNDVTKQYKQLNLEQKNAEKDSKLQTNKNLFSTNIDTWMNKNTTAAKVFSEQLTDIKTKLSTADSVEFDNLKRQFLNIQAEAKQMGLTTSGVVKEIKEGFNSAVTNVVSFTAAMSTFRKMVDTAKSLDTSLFNLQVATGQTREETKGLMNTYNQMAKELGSTTNEIAEAADAWLRQGRSIDETNELIKDSAILSKIGMIDSADATEYLTSSLNGFKLSADSALAVISKLNAVDMNAAASAGGIAESMSKTASSAQQAGVSIDQLIGMIATLTDVSQASPENVGTAMKSIISRYTQVKANKFVDYESGDDLSNVEKVLAKVGVKIRDGVTDFRDLGDVLDELAGKWNTLNDVEQNAISYNLFGSYQSNFGRILLSNWDKVEKLTEISETSSTEALDKFSAYTDSVQSHINSMIASYEHLASVIADSEFLKGAADTGAAFLDTISAIIDKLGVMSTAMGAVTAGAALKGHTLGVFDNNGTDITFLGKTLEEMKQASAEGQKFGGLFTSNVIQPISNAQSVIDNYNKLVANQCVNQDRINRLTDDLDMRKYLSGLNGAEAGMKGYTASLNMGTAATMGLKVATVALNMAFNMAVMAAVTASVSFLVNKYKELNPTVEEATSALEENQNELLQHNDKVKELSNQLKETQDRLEELNDVGGIKSLTDQEEVDRLKNVTEELKTQLSVEKERQALKARETLESADKAYKSYDQLYTSDGSVIGGKEEAMAYGSSNPAQEMEYTIAAYKRVQEEYDRITQEMAKHAQLAAQKYIDANASNDLKDATLDEYVQFLNEASGSEVSKAALAQLELAKLAVNNVKIDTASDIEQVIALANAAGASAANLLELQRAESILGQVEAGTLDMDVPGNNMLLDYANNTKNKLNNNTFKFEYEELDPEKFKKAVYDGGVKTNTPSKGSSGSKGAKENSTIDWIKRSAELLERESTRLQTAIDDTWKAYTGLSQADIERVQELFSMNLTPNSDEVNELLDYADKLGVSIGELQDLANNNGLESRQSLLEQLIDVDKQRLDQGIDSLNYYKNSYEEYVAKVPEYRDKIENGGIDIESFSGDEKTKIENAMNAYDSYLNQKKTNLELSNTIRDNELKYYTIAIDEIDKKNARLSNSNDLIQKQIDLLNTQGVTVSSSMYDQLISNTEGQIGYQQEKLQKQKDQLIKAITEEGLKVGSDKWYELNDEIMSTEGSIKDLEKAQAEYEKQLRELPITNLEKLGTIYQNILDTIQNWGAEMEASGKTLNADYYQKLINNANTSISNYKEEIEAIQDVMSDYDPGTDNWNEMNDKLQQCNSSISSLVQNMHKWNEELLNLPIQKISDASDSLSKIVDGLNDVKSEHETVISAVTGAISDEIDRLNDEKEAYEDTINDQKEALQDRMDLLDKQNEKLKLQAQYEQALYDLENATTQKTEKVIRNGELTYEANADNLRNAQETVQDSLAALKKQELQDQMDALDDALDDYNDKLQDTLDSLQKISDKWSEIASKKEQADNEKTATDILGKNWKDKVLSGNDNDIFQMFSKLYTDNVDQINKYQEQIDSTEHISSLIQEYIDSYKAGTLTYEEAQAGIHDLVSQMNQKMSAMDNLQNIYNYMGKVYDTAADGNSVFVGIQKAFSESGNQLISSLEQYQANAGLISESMSSWQQLTNNVESIKDILEDVKDNLKDTERDSDSKKDKDDNVRGSGNSHVTGKHSSKSVYGSSGFSAEKHHSGVFSGAVGSSSADKTDKIRVLEAEKLGPNEIPAVLERGEMVFTPEQMEKLVASFSATAYVPDNSWIKNMYPSATVNTKPNVVNVSVGDVKLTDVRDVDGFAKAMGKDFVPLARQAMARF